MLMGLCECCLGVFDLGKDDILIEGVEKFTSEYRETSVLFGRLLTFNDLRVFRYFKPG